MEWILIGLAMVLTFCMVIALLLCMMIAQGYKTLGEWSKGHLLYATLPTDCLDCGRHYGNEYGFPDLVLPNDVWAKISPTGDEGGMLCPSCICKRLVDRGLEDVPAVFRSGPCCVLAATTNAPPEVTEEMVETYAALRQGLRRALWRDDFWPNNPGVGDDEIVHAVDRLMDERAALATAHEEGK
jgi:hypothetical protein